MHTKTHEVSTEGRAEGDQVESVAELLQRELTLTQDLAQAVKPALEGSVAAKLGKVSITQKHKRLLLKYQDVYESIIGVDITANMIRVGLMDKAQGKNTVKKIAQVSVPTGSEDVLITQPKLYSEKLKNLLKKEKIKIRHAAVALPENLAVIKTITLPLMTDEQIKQAIEFGSFWENFVTLSEDFSAYSIHYDVLVQNEEQQTMDILFVAAKHADIKPYTDILTEAGLLPVIIDVRCFSLFSALQLEGKISQEDRAAYLKLDSSGQYVYILEKAVPFLYEIYVTDQDKEQLDARAEDYEFVRRLASQVQQVISSHEATQNVEKITQLYVLETLKTSELLARKMGMLLAMYTVGMVKLMDKMSMPATKTLTVGNDNNVGRSGWAVTLGLAIHSWDAFSSQHSLHGVGSVNLLPNVESIRQTSRVKAVSRLALMCLSVLALSTVGASYVWLGSQGKNYRNEIASLQPMQQKYKELSAEVGQLKVALDGLAQLKTTQNKLSSNQKSVLAAYESIYDVLPYGVWLENVRFSAPAELEIIGNALSDQNILEFIRVLNTNPIFEKVSLKNMQTKVVTGGEMSEVKSFSLSCLLKVAK